MIDGEPTISQYHHFTTVTFVFTVIGYKRRHIEVESYASKKLKNNLQKGWLFCLNTGTRLVGNFEKQKNKVQKH